VILVVLFDTEGYKSIVAQFSMSIRDEGDEVTSSDVSSTPHAGV